MEKETNHQIRWGKLKFQVEKNAYLTLEIVSIGVNKLNPSSFLQTQAIETSNVAVNKANRQ